jgi:hypothetical protein
MVKFKICMAAMTAFFGWTSSHLNAVEVASDIQNTPKQHQEQVIEPSYWIVWEDQVKPDQRTAYEAKVLAIVNKVKQSSNPIRIFTFYESSTAKYYYLYPYKDTEEWNKIFTFWKQESELENINHLLQNYSIFISQTIPEFSHISLDKQLSVQNPNYLRVDKFQVYPNQEPKFLELLKEWVAQTHAKASDCGWFVQKILIGNELPAYLVLWGDCLKSKENIKQFENFLIEKQAYGTVIKKIISEDKLFVPKLSTVPLKIL